MVKCWRWNEEKLEPRFNFEGHQLGVVSVDINLTGTSILQYRFIYTIILVRGFFEVVR